MKKLFFALFIMVFAASAMAQTPEEKAAAKAAKAAQKAAEKEALGHLTDAMKQKAAIDGFTQAITAEQAKGEKANPEAIAQHNKGIHDAALEGMKSMRQAIQSGNLPEKKLFDAHTNADVMSSHLLNAELMKAAQQQPFDTTLFVQAVYDVSEACVGELQYGNPKDEVQKGTISGVRAKLPRILEFIAYACQFSMSNGDMKGTCEAFDRYLAFPEQVTAAEANHPLKDKLNAELAPRLAFNIYYTAYQKQDPATMDKYYDLAAKYDDAESHAFVLASHTQVYLQMGDTAKWVELTRANIMADPASPVNETPIQNLLAYYQRAQGVDAMAKFADEVLAAAPESKIANYGKGYSLFAQDKYMEALAYYKKCTELDPTYVDAFYQCGTCLSNIGAANNRKINDDADKGKYTTKTKVKFGQNMTEAQERAANAAMQAANKASQAAMDKDIAEKVRPYYEQAIPYFEKVRELVPDKSDRWAYELRQCYYVLKDKAKQDEMEQYLK